jgi:hypothetical protein
VKNYPLVTVDELLVKLLYGINFYAMLVVVKKLLSESTVKKIVTPKLRRNIVPGLLFMCMACVGVCNRHPKRISSQILLTRKSSTVKLQLFLI